MTREETYVIQHPKEGVLHYKEWLDDSGKVIDSTLRSKHGVEINDPILMEEIWEYIDFLESGRLPYNKEIL